MMAFDSNCTVPPEGVTFVSSPYIRGTLDILWSCVSILLICTWSILHLNVPPQSTIDPNSNYQKYGRAIARLGRKAMWMMLNIIAPEWLFAKAWSDFWSVRLIQKEFEALKEHDRVPWSLTHTYLANMGGFGIKFGPESSGSGDAVVETGAIASYGDTENMTEPERRARKAHKRAAQEATAVQKTKAPTQAAGDEEEPEIKSRKLKPKRLPSKKQRQLGQITAGVDIRTPAAATPNQSLLGSLATNNHKVPYALKEASRVNRTRPLPSHTDQPLTIPIFQQHLDSTLRALPDKPMGATLMNVAANETTLKSPEKSQIGALPDQDRKWIDWLLRWGINRGEELQTRMAHLFGEVDWHLDDKNVNLVVEACRTVNRSHFKGEWEWNRFLRGIMFWYDNIHRLQGDLWIVDARQLLLARELGIIDKLPEVAVDDIDDRNKGDTFVKILAVLQIIWFVLQLLTRLYRHFPTTQLEIMTFAFAICAAAAYCLLLNKPKDVAYTTVISAVRRPITASELSRMALVGPSNFWIGKASVWIRNNSIHVDHRKTADGGAKGRMMMVGAAIAVSIFGSAHFIAWNFDFPTEIEKKLWHASTIITVASIPFAFFIHAILNMLRILRRQPVGQFTSVEGLIDDIIVLATWCVYCAARLFTLVEVLRTLAFLPPKAFIITWPEALPHVT